MQVTHIHAYILQETSFHGLKRVSEMEDGSDVEKDGEEVPTDDCYNDDDYEVKLPTLHLVQYTACSFHMVAYIYVYAVYMEPWFCCVKRSMSQFMRMKIMTKWSHARNKRRRGRIQRATSNGAKRRGRVTAQRGRGKDKTKVKMLISDDHSIFKH